MGVRDFRGAAKQTTLLAGISNSDTSFTVASGGGTGYPTGSDGDFTVALDMGLAGEEKILCSARTGDTFTVATSGRGWDDTTAASHANNATVTHVGTATDLREANQHVNNVAADPHPQYLTTAEANALYAPLSGAGAPITLVGCGLARDAAQSIANLGTNVAWDTEDFDTNALHDLVTNPDRITIPAGKGGYYQINTVVTFVPSATGTRRLYLSKNGGTVKASEDATPDGTIATSLAISALLSLSAGDYITVQAWQNTGAALNIDPQGIRGNTLSVYRVGV